MDERKTGSLQNRPESGANPLEILIEKLDRERRINALKIIRQTTETLSEEDRLLVRMVYGADQPVSVAARVMNVSASAARRRLKHILIKIREKLLAEGIREP
jgi:DNA-directed RNA polymerase specialized sigma subunit